MVFVRGIESEDTGGHCMVDFIHLSNGKVIGVNDECWVVYPSMHVFYTGEGYDFDDLPRAEYGAERTPLDDDGDLPDDPLLGMTFLTGVEIFNRLRREGEEEHSRGLRFTLTDGRTKVVPWEAFGHRIPEFDFGNVTPENCQDWIRALHAADLLYHFDDNPREIGNTVNGEWQQLFTEEESQYLDAVMVTMFAMAGKESYDPFDLACDLNNEALTQETPREKKA